MTEPPMTGPRGTIRLPARDIPVPASVSKEAQAVIANTPAERTEYPALDDPEAWRAMIAAHDGAIAAMMAGRAAAPVTVRNRDLAGCRVYEITPDGLGEGDDRVYLDIHGGGFIWGGGELCATMGTGTAIRMAARVWAVDYRMPPDHPFPAALDDCLTAYRALLDERPPDRIIVGGASAGGNLAAALILRARDEGLPLPAAVVLMTPGTAGSWAWRRKTRRSCARSGASRTPTGTRRRRDQRSVQPALRGHLLEWESP